MRSLREVLPGATGARRVSAAEREAWADTLITDWDDWVLVPEWMTFDQAERWAAAYDVPPDRLIKLASGQTLVPLRLNRPSIELSAEEFARMTRVFDAKRRL